MDHPIHSRTAILASLLETLERHGGSADRHEVSAVIRRKILGADDRMDQHLDAMITGLIRRALVAEWITAASDSPFLLIGKEGRHVLDLHRQGHATLSRLIRRPRSQVLGNRGRG